MPEIPKTSITLLNAIARDSDSARWTEFYRTYESMMRSFLVGRYPMVDADDIIQETMLVLMKRLPDYQYLPDKKGHFRNWLTGVLKFKAQDCIRRRTREAHKIDQYQSDLELYVMEVQGDAEFEAWQEHAREAALEQLLADPKLREQHRQIFRRLLNHESPQVVAEAYGTTRANVDKIKQRCVEKLTRLVADMLERD